MSLAARLTHCASFTFSAHGVIRSGFAGTSETQRTMIGTSSVRYLTCGVAQPASNHIPDAKKMVFIAAHPGLRSMSARMMWCR
jgi:hypothetical protein